MIVMIVNEGCVDARVAVNEAEGVRHDCGLGYFPAEAVAATPEPGDHVAWNAELNLETGDLVFGEPAPIPPTP